MANVMETDPKNLKGHSGHYVLDVILFARNFKWLLLGLILTAMAVFTMFLGSLNTARATLYLKRFQLVSYLDSRLLAIKEDHGSIVEHYDELLLD